MGFAFLKFARSKAGLLLCVFIILLLKLYSEISAKNSAAQESYSLVLAAPTQGWTPLKGDWDGNNTDTVGLYNHSSNLFLLRNNNTPGFADITFNYGNCGLSGCLPLVGDWNGDGVDTVGLFNPSTNLFALRNSNTTGVADVNVNYGDCGLSGCLPLVGDWNGDGVDTVGLFNPGTNLFALRNSNTTGVADVNLNYGNCGLSGCLPLVGDWNGDGVDTVGLFNPSTNLFALRNSNTTGVADVNVNYGDCGLSGCLPLVGDWNGDGVDTVGLFNPGTNLFALRNSNTTGVADVNLNYGIPIPIIPDVPPATNCDVPHFWQEDPAWTGELLKDCGTIGAFGCTLTSATMIFNYYGANLTPATLSNRMGNWACPFHWSQGEANSDGKAFFEGTYSFSWEQLDYEINQNDRPVIVGMRKWCNTFWCTHWIVVVRGSGNEFANYTINDPGYKGGAGMNFSIYNEQSGWEPTHIAVYSGQSRCTLTAQASILNKDTIQSHFTLSEKDSYFLEKPLTVGLNSSEVVTGTVIVYRTTTMTMTLELAAYSTSSNVTEMLVSSDTVANTTWQPFSQYVALPVSNTVYVQFRDETGNVSGQASTKREGLVSVPNTPDFVIFLPLTKL